MWIVIYSLTKKINVNLKNLASGAVWHTIAFIVPAFPFYLAKNLLTCRFGLQS